MALVQIVEMLENSKKLNLQNQEHLKKKLDDMPNGKENIVIKKSYGIEYVYYIYYCPKSKKTISKFIGKDKSVIPTMKEQIAEREVKRIEEKEKLKQELKSLKDDLVKIEKMLKISNEPTQPKGIRKDLIKTQEANSVPIISSETFTTLDLPIQINNTNEIIKNEPL